jgi:hypothetical protein
MLHRSASPEKYSPRFDQERIRAQLVVDVRLARRADGRYRAGRRGAASGALLHGFPGAQPGFPDRGAEFRFGQVAGTTVMGCMSTSFP